MKIFVISGAPQCGKTEFIEKIEKINEEKGLEEETIISESPLMELEEVATMIGWEGQKTDKDMYYLSQLKKLCENWFDGPMKSLFSRIEELIDYERNYFESWQQANGLKLLKYYIFIEMNDSADIERLKNFCLRKHISIQTILIRHSRKEWEYYKDFERADIFNYKYDYVIENNHDLDILTKQANWFYDNHMKKEENYIKRDNDYYDERRNRIGVWY